MVFETNFAEVTGVAPFPLVFLSITIFFVSLVHQFFKPIFHVVLVHPIIPLSNPPSVIRFIGVATTLGGAGGLYAGRYLFTTVLSNKNMPVIIATITAVFFIQDKLFFS